jgi:hypothetical protein
VCITEELVPASILRVRSFPGDFIASVHLEFHQSISPFTQNASQLKQESELKLFLRGSSAPPKQAGVTNSPRRAQMGLTLWELQPRFKMKLCYRDALESLQVNSAVT